jgi:hypothetical protein
LWQKALPFRARAERIDRRFKTVILVTTIALVTILLSALPTGRYAASWLAARARWLAIGALGRGPDRSEIDQDHQRKRRFDIEQATGKLQTTFAEYTPRLQKLLRYAGLDPEHVLIRWGNLNRTVLLPSTVFEAEDSRRWYRLRPNVRSIWVRNFPVKGDVKAYFPAPHTPELAALAQGTGAIIVEGSVQTTNSWGLRGPEPDLGSAWRGIILGDSYMQGLFVADQQTPSECLKRDLKTRLAASVEILNTGHLGYSPEQYYYTLLEYAPRFPPQFVVVSFFANDFGEVPEVLEGMGDWQESGYWLNQIDKYCQRQGIVCLFVPAPWLNQIEGPLRAGFYPGMAANTLDIAGPCYLDPMANFTNAHLVALSDSQRQRKPLAASPLFNGRIGDGHFSPQGCEVWARAVGRRLASLIETGNGREPASHPVQGVAGATEPR